MLTVRSFSACIIIIAQRLALLDEVKLITISRKLTVANFHRVVSYKVARRVASFSGPYSAAGLTGNSQIVGLVDTGIDDSSCYFSDIQHGPVVRSDSTSPVLDLRQRVIVQYAILRMKVK